MKQFTIKAEFDPDAQVCRSVTLPDAMASAWFDIAVFAGAH